jgi:mannose-6-phosphate isomerase-like protein (cupin superfamily)
MISEEQIRKAITSAFPLCPLGIVANFVRLASIDVDEAVAEATLRLRKPYGDNNLFGNDGDLFGISLMRMNLGARTSLHTHDWRHELFYVRSGVLTLRTQNSQNIESEQSVRPGEFTQSVPGQPHSAMNLGNEPLVAMELVSPFLIDDKNRLEDPYERRLGHVTHAD